ncbi:MAG TPA: ATP-binding protein [Longimicrobium sp.]|nr:ATP-binding protein [Longimicrobium sp.]
MSDTFDLSELLGDFRDEARAQLALLDAALLEVERGDAPAPATRVEVLRALHTLKGNAGMLGFRPVQNFVHAVEEVFRGAGNEWTGLPLAGLQAATTAMRRAVDRAGTPEEEAAFFALAGVALHEAGPPPGPRGAPDDNREAPPEAEPGDEVRASDLREDVLRVPFARLDGLLDRAGELNAAVAALEHWVTANRDALDAAGVRRSLADRLEAVGAASEAVRRGSAELRLVPVGRVFARFPVLAADIARARAKRVAVMVEGEGTELDKSAADALMEPLLHLVRNAVDHGVETPAEREAAGKEPEGTLWLRASQEGDQVRIEVEDDGRGLDRDAIARRARERGLAGSDVGEWDADELADLIFRPGFSTRDEADEFSGRGVGLDAVRGAVARLRGSVTVEDGDEGGTRFVLRLPLTVATIPILLFQSGGETLAIPALDVEEMTHAGTPGRVGRAETVEVRGEAVPLVRLRRVFGWDGDDADPRYLLVVRRGGRAVALGADRLLAQRPSTVRALPAALGSPRGVSGATIDALGRVILLLDPQGVMELNVDLYRGGKVG